MVLVLALALPAAAFTTVCACTAPHPYERWVIRLAELLKSSRGLHRKQPEQYIAEHTTALKEIQQVENEIVQLERMGDPKAYGANLPGVQVITGLAQIYQQGKQDAEDWADLR